MEVNKKNSISTIPTENIGRRIYFIRGQKVMLDADLAELFGVETKVLVQSVKRNLKRFPSDFMFQLNPLEYNSLRSQFVTSNIGRGGRRYLPYAFTEHGVTMLSSVLNSDRAVSISIVIVRVFIKIREILASNKELAYKVEELERMQKTQNKHINALYSILGRLIEEPVNKKEPIGFRKPGLLEKQKT